MHFLDWRWLLTLLLLSGVLIVYTTIMLDRRLFRTSSRLPVPEEPLENLLARAPVGILLLAGERHYRYANLRARQWLGLPGMRGILPSEKQWPELLVSDRREARAQNPPTGCYRSVPVEGRRLVRWWVSPWGADDVVLLEDVTTQQRAEQGANFLISDLSHELRTPLATLLTHLEVLRLPDLPAETREQSIRLLREETNRMSRLVHSLLELGRLETSSDLDLRAVELVTVAQEALAQISPGAERRGITIALRSDPALPYVGGDSDRLRQLFLILLDNAVKYSRPGDEVTVECRGGDGVVKCSVCDTGPGIPSQHLPHITQRFYRAGSGQGIQGSGLGLALASEIARHHSSELHITSDHDGTATGTCVRFALPAIGREE